MNQVCRGVKTFFVIVIAAGALALCALTTPASAQEQIHVIDTVTHVNENCDVAVDSSQIVLPSSSKSALSLSSQAVDEDGYETSAAAIASQIRNNMVNRVSRMTLCYKTVAPSSFDAMIESLLSKATAHNGIATQGDYLDHQYSAWSARASYFTRSGKNCYTITLAITYYTTKAQEQVVDATVNSILSTSSFVSASTTYEKIRASYDWITKNVSYDYANASSSDVLSHSAYAAFVSHKCVCQGYALAFYRLCLEQGVDSRYISGVANGSNHGWNIVKAGSKYYHADATWDAGKKQYTNFLKGSNSNFTLTHVLASEFKTSSFTSTYPVAGSNYSLPGESNVDDPVDSDYVAGTVSDKYFQSGAPISKLRNTAKCSISTKTVKNNKKRKVAIKVTKAKGKVTFSVSKKGKKAGLSISKKGKLTVKKKAKPGTYTISVKVAGNATYRAMVFKIKFKVTR